jgi:hypothetical protein
VPEKVEFVEAWCNLWGGLTERLLVATAASYVVSPGALGPVAADPSREVDRLSASYLIALGARVVRKVGDLVRRANEAGKRLATDLKRRGVMIGANDLFIAAHARVLRLTLVTNNIAEFERVRDLKLENWTLPARRSRR